MKKYSYLMFVESGEGKVVYTRSSGIRLRLVGNKEDYNIINNLKFDEWNCTTLKNLGEAGYDLVHVVNSGIYLNKGSSREGGVLEIAYLFKAEIEEN